jgi:ribose 5-phosphate isomerase B
MIVAVGSDHRGFAHKQRVAEHLRASGMEVLDFGCHSSEAADYPDAALPAAEMVGSGRAQAGVLICGSGIGMSIAANKVRGVRASLCFTEDQARTTRRHNDSNILCLSGDAVSPDQAVTLLEAWLSASFEGGRHARRVEKFIAWEDAHMKQE